MWVVRIGSSRYVVFDGLHRIGDYYEHAVFDDRFQYLVTIVG